MPRKSRQLETSRSEHWLRTAIEGHSDSLNARIRASLGLPPGELIEWLSPVRSDDFAEYQDQSFLDRLGVASLSVPLDKFWPTRGPQWDGLAVTGSKILLLVEAKAYIEEAVDYGSSASNPDSINRIGSALSETKAFFRARREADWNRPFYQYANRLAHLYFLRELNHLDARLIFLNFADAPDVPHPCTVEEFKGAGRLIEKSLGLGSHPIRSSIATICWSVPEMLADR